MKALLAALLVLSVDLSAAESGEVTLPLAEYLAQRAADAPVATPERPPVEFAVTNAAVTLSLTEGRLTGIARFGVATFAEGWHLVPLIGGEVNVLSVEPADAALVTREGWLALQIRDAGRREVVIEFSSVRGDGASGWGLDLPAVVAGSVEVIAKPADREVLLVSSGTRVDGATAYLTSRAASLEIALTDQRRGPAPKELPKIAVDGATVPKAEFRTRVVADGALFCEAKIVVRHLDRTSWTFRLPKESRLLACTVGGEPASPAVLENGDLALPLDAPGKDRSTVVGITYTGAVSEFDPVRGDFRVALPWTPLFVEEIDWRLTLPGGYEASAFDGNVEVAPAGEGGDLHFQKRLARGEAAAVQIFYTKSVTD